MRTLIGLLLLAACTQEPDGPELVVDETDALAVGTFEGSYGPVAFRAERIYGTYDLEIEMNGLVITALLDPKAGVFEYDGYAAGDGGDTQMGDDDRAALIELRDALARLGSDPESPLGRLRRLADVWAEFPSTLDMRLETFTTQNSYQSICSLLNTYQSASHDCSGRDWWQDSTTLDYAYVSMHPAGSCGDGTYFFKNGTWQCYEPDHDTNVEYAYGNCLGRCGAGCGTDRQFTWDCLDHDECIRVGHDTASWWCDDQFASSNDDWANAPQCY